MHTEIALDPKSSASQRMTARGHIYNDMNYIRSAAAFSEGSRRHLRTLEAILSSKGLMLESTNASSYSAPEENVLSDWITPGTRTSAGPRYNAGSGGDVASPSMAEAPVHALNSSADLRASDIRIDLQGRDHEDWLNDLVGFNLMSADDLDLGFGEQ